MAIDKLKYWIFKTLHMERTENRYSNGRISLVDVTKPPQPA